MVLGAGRGACAGRPPCGTGCGPRFHRRRRQAGHADLFHRARHGAGLLHGRHPFPGRRQAGGSALHRRPAREEGRRARQDRSAPLSGGPRPGQGQEGAGRGAARLRRQGPRPLQDAGGEGGRIAAERRSPAGHCRPAQGLHRRRRGDDRDRADQSRLHHHPCTERRAHGRAPGGSRQHRPCQRRRGDRDAGADPALLGHVHLAVALARRCARGHEPGAGRGHGLRPGQPQGTRQWDAAPGRQHHRPGERDHQAQGHVPQQGREALAGRVRQCARAGRHEQRCRGGPVGGDPAWAGRPVRMGRQCRGQGRASSGPDRPAQ